MYMTLQKGQDCKDRKQISGFQELGVGRGDDNKGHEGIWQVTETLCILIMVVVTRLLVYV